MAALTGHSSLWVVWCSSSGGGGGGGYERFSNLEDLIIRRFHIKL
jgi:hypothetical protein